MKGKTIIQIVLAVVIVGLAYLVYNSIQKPMRFDNEYTKRRDACAEKLKSIRTLEEAYKVTYGRYCGNFDTLFTRLMTEDSMKVVSKQINRDKIPADVDINDVPENEAVKNGWISRVEVLVNPVAKLREDGKLPTIDAATGKTRQLTDEEIRNLRYVPYPKGEKNEFELYASQIEKSGFMIPVFLCQVPHVLLSDMDEQLVVNKIAEIHEVKDRYAGWKVGDTTQAITDGNFE
jgi:Tfp pilus assembly protein PilE